MRRIGRWAAWVGVAVAVVLSLLTVGQASSTVPPIRVFQANVQGLAIGNYHSADLAVPPLSQRVIDDADRDVMTTPGTSVAPSAATTEPVVTSAEPNPTVPTVPTATPAPTLAPTPTPAPTPVATVLPAGSITGSVQDSQRPVGIANALVSLTPADLLAVTNAKGAFSFPSVSAGTYLLTASATGYASGSATITVTAGHTANINLHLVSTTPGGAVQGMVKSSASGKAVAGATVALGPGILATITDSTGYYAFPSVAPGAYTLTVTAATYQSSSQSITVVSGHTVKVNVSLTPV